MSEENEPGKEEIEAAETEVEQAEADVEGHGISAEVEVDSPVLDVNFGC
ncbi:hypothetical protein [Streptomyces sp. RFCAC02]|nr:hypothetical protein [Streptomyces sp. RFCAC02]